MNWEIEIQEGNRRTEEENIFWIKMAISKEIRVSKKIEILVKEAI